MSRTIRRKGDRQGEREYRWYSTEAEFLYGLSCSQIDFSEMIACRPTRPTKPQFIISIKQDTMREQYTINPDAADEWRSYFAFFNTPDYKLYREAVKFIKRGLKADSWNEYLRISAKISQTDKAYGSNYLNRAPTWYCNIYFERPMRRSVKAALKKAYRYDTFDETVFNETCRGAAWSYW